MRKRDRVCKPPGRIPKSGIWVWIEDSDGKEHCVFFHPTRKWIGSIFYYMDDMTPEAAYEKGYRFKRKDAPHDAKLKD